MTVIARQPAIAAMTLNGRPSRHGRNADLFSGQDQVQFSGLSRKTKAFLPASILMALTMALLPRSSAFNQVGDITASRSSMVDIKANFAERDKDPLKYLPQEIRNQRACQDDGNSQPVVTTESAAQLAEYMAERSAFIVVEGNTGVDISKPVTPKPYQEAREGVYGGSGFFCREEGQIITNMHVVERAMVYGSDIKVKLSDGTEYFAKVKAADPRRDVALLQLQNTGGRKFKTMRLVQNSDKLMQGDALAAYGNPRFLEGTFSIGHLSALNRLGQKSSNDFSETKIDEVVPKHQMTTPIAPGNSGGGVATMKGFVAGITQSYKNEPGSMNFMIPANAIGDFMTVLEFNKPLEGMVFGTAILNSALDQYPRMIEKQEQSVYIAKQALLYAEQRSENYKAGKPDEDLKKMKPKDANEKLESELKTARERVQSFEKVLGEYKETYRKASANAGTHVAEGGLIVSEITKGSLAEKAGIHSHDVITHVNGQPVKTTDEYTMKLKSMYAYQSFELTYYRDGIKQTVTVNPDTAGVTP